MADDYGPPPPAGATLPPLSTSRYAVQTVGRAVQRSGLRVSTAFGERRQGAPGARAVEEAPEVAAARAAAAQAGGWGAADLELPEHVSALQEAARRPAPVPGAGKRLTFGQLAALVSERKAGRRAMVEAGDVDGAEPDYLDPAAVLSQPGARSAVAKAAQALAHMQRGSR